MTASRVAAAAAAIVTALLLQATVVGPAAYPWPASLPAVLVAAVAFAGGPATGMSFGFAAGLLADLGSHHPAGVLALCWLAVGLVCGRFADQRSVRRDAVLAAVVCAAQSAVTVMLLSIVHGYLGVEVGTAAVRHLLPTALIDGALALVVVPLVRAALRTASLRPARVPATPGTLTAAAPLAGSSSRD
ncbi:MAG TPA: rod shape-determining protein MreD [Jatrophihabitans sp.]|nr:rod shape-determining protein MreD [Jatrophihabitans sp.]